MNPYTIQGRLRLHQGNFGNDLLFIKEHTGTLSEPIQEKQESGYDKFWCLDFAATPAQWRILEPELEKRGIFATLLESPHYHEEAVRAEQLVLNQISRKSNYWFIYLIGVMIWFAGLLSFALTHHVWLTIIIIAAGYVVMGIGRALVATYRERSRGLK